MNGDDDGAARHARPAGERRSVWWAGLGPEALEDETEANRRAERWLVPAGLVAVAVTVLVLLGHGGSYL